MLMARTINEGQDEGDTELDQLSSPCGAVLQQHSPEAVTSRHDAHPGYQAIARTEREWADQGFISRTVQDHPQPAGQVDHLCREAVEHVVEGDHRHAECRYERRG